MPDFQGQQNFFISYYFSLLYAKIFVMSGFFIGTHKCNSCAKVCKDEYLIGVVFHNLSQMNTLLLMFCIRNKNKAIQVNCYGLRLATCRKNVPSDGKFNERKIYQKLSVFYCILLIYIAPDLGIKSCAPVKSI